MPSAVGDTCLCCKPKWEKQGKPLLKLVELPKVRSQNKTLAVCTYCDAPVIEQAEDTVKRHAAD